MNIDFNAWMLSRSVTSDFTQVDTQSAEINKMLNNICIYVCLWPFLYSSEAQNDG